MGNTRFVFVKLNNHGMCQNTALWSGFPLIVYFTTGTDNWNGLSHPQAVRPEQQLGSQRRLPSVPASPAPDGRTKPPRNGEGQTKPPCNKTSPVTDTGGGWGGRGTRRGGTEAQMRRREEGVRRQSRHCCQWSLHPPRALRQPAEQRARSSSDTLLKHS